MKWSDFIQKRPKCGGYPTTPTYFLGTCNQFSNHPQIVPVYDSDTSSSLQNGAVVEFIGQPQNPEAIPACGGGGGTCDTGANPSCGPFSSTNNPTCHGGDIVISTGDYPWHSCFKPELTASGSQSYIDLSGNCQPQWGFKNVQSVKYHHGILSPMSRDNSQPYDGFALDTNLQCTYCRWTNARTVPDQTRYLTVSSHVRFDDVNQDGTTIFAECYRSCSVGKYTGFPTYHGSDASGSSDPTINPAGQMSDVTGQLGSYTYNTDILLSTFCDAEAGFLGFPSGYTSGSTTTSIGCNSATITRTWKLDDGVWETSVISIDLAAGTYSNTATGEINWLTKETGIHEQTTITLTPTSIVTRGYTNHGSGLGTDDAKTMLSTFYFSDPYYGSEVESYAKDTLLAQWDMGANYYPWRHDNLYTVGPIVSTDEIGPTVPDLQRSVTYTFTADPMPTGTLIGQPLDFSTHYLKNVVSRRHEIFHHCNNGSYEEWYISTFGQPNAGTNVPMSATQWTDDFVASQLRPYAHLTFQDQTYRAQKWAVTLPPKQSYNYARPCGADRYLYDESTVACVVTYDSPSKYVTLSEFQTYAAGDVVYLCGTTFDGGYKIASGADNAYTLGDMVFSASAYIDPYNGFVGCGAGRIGKLRFPSCPPICGRHFITGVTTNTGSAMTMSIDAQSFLRTGDSIQCVSSSFDGTYTITVIDRSTIALPFSGALSYTAKGYIRSTTSQPWQWDDTTSKGDYTLTEWQFNYRDIGEWQRISASIGPGIIGPDGLACSDGVGNACGGFNLPYANPRAAQVGCGMPQEVSAVSCSQHCIGQSPCGPPVIVISPSSNTETFPNMNRYDMGSIGVDTVYGADWVMKVNLWDTDYLYQQPHAECGDAGSGFNLELGPWLEDDGNCHAQMEIQADTSIWYWYPRRNYYEARCSPPAGSPSLPSGVYMGCLNTSQLASSCVGNVCTPPAVLGFDAPAMDEVQLYGNEMGCVCASGDFASVYEANGIVCNEVGI